MTQSANPLRAWFRQPVIYIRLPSNGEYWPADAIEVPANGELPVLPMTALDEISYRTPDALFNGQAVVDVIQSCVPAIKNAWCTPSMDINSLLISIRIASYGHDMEIESTCPSCSESHEYNLDMRSMLDRIVKPDYTKSVRTGEIEVFFRPMTFQQQTQVSMDQYETQRMIASAQSENIPDNDKIKAMTNVMKKISVVTTQALTHAIAGIRTPTAFVDDANHITEFLSNCDRVTYDAIKNHAMDLRGGSDIKPVTITCANCEHTYEQIIELNMSNFFAVAS